MMMMPSYFHLKYKGNLPILKRTTPTLIPKAIKKNKEIQLGEGENISIFVKYQNSICIINRNVICTIITDHIVNYNFSAHISEFHLCLVFMLDVIS